MLNPINSLSVMKGTRLDSSQAIVLATLGPIPLKSRINFGFLMEWVLGAAFFVVLIRLGQLLFFVWARAQILGLI